MRLFFQASVPANSHLIVLIPLQIAQGGREAQGRRTWPPYIQRNLHTHHGGAGRWHQGRGGKATRELHNALSAVSEELTKQQAEELRALEERLVAKHREELSKAVEAATAKAQESAPACTCTCPQGGRSKWPLKWRSQLLWPLGRQSSKGDARLASRKPSRAAGWRVG